MNELTFADGIKYLSDVDIEYAKYAEYAEYAKYAKYAKYAE